MRTRTRRELLSTLGAVAVAGSTGCTQVKRLGPLQSSQSADWPLLNYGPEGSRSLRTDQGPAPESPPEQQWTSAEAIAPPVIADGSMFVPRFEDEIAALDPVSGSTRWVSEVASSKSPAVRDETVYATTLENTLVAIDTENGERRWSVDLPELDGRSQVSGAPVVERGRVYVKSSTGDGKQAGVFVADGTTGDTVWTQRITKRSDEEGIVGGFNTIAVGDQFVVVSAGPRLVAYDRTTGERVWQRSVDTAGDRFSTSPTIADGSVYAATEQGSLLRLKLATGTVDWKESVPDETQPGVAASSLAVDGESVYLASQQVTDPPNETGIVRCFDREAGAQMWRTAVEGGCLAQPAITERTAYLGTVLGYLYALDTETGEIRWRTGESSNEVYGLPCVITETGLYTVDEGIQCWR